MTVVDHVIPKQAGLIKDKELYVVVYNLVFI